MVDTVTAEVGKSRAQNYDTSAVLHVGLLYVGTSVI